MPIPAPPDATVVDLDAVKLHLNIDAADDTDDDELAGFIDAAVNVVENYIGPVLSRTEVDVFLAQQSYSLLLSTMPVLDVTSVVATRWGLTSLTYDVSRLILDPKRGTIRVPGGPAAGPFIGDVTGTAPPMLPFLGDVTVTYTVGRTDVPASVRLATLELIRRWWETSQRGAGSTSFTPSFGAPPEEESSPPWLGYGMPDDVLQLLAPYRQASAVG